MYEKEYISHGIRMTILQKDTFEMTGFKKPTNLGDGSIAAFLNQLTESGSMKKLTKASGDSQVWVCLSDCQSCGMGCVGYHVCCRVCVEKNDSCDFSSFGEEDLYTFVIPASKWVMYETHDSDTTRALHQIGIYEVMKEVGYRWNESIRLHFDNEHECYDARHEWIPGKTYHLLLPVVLID